MIKRLIFVFNSMFDGVNMKIKYLFILFFCNLFLFSCKNGFINKSEKAKCEYNVYHRKENIEDDFCVDFEIEKKEGYVGEETQAEPKKLTGFEPGCFNQKTISEDGNTIIIIEYYRKRFEFVFMDEKDTITTIVGKYESKVPLEKIPNPEKEDFIFEKWDKEIPETFSKNIIFKAIWKGNETPYLVKHYKQNIYDDDYSLIDEEPFIGNAGKQTEAKAKKYTGFTPKPISQQTIDENGKTVVSVYYDRNIYSIHFNTNGGNQLDSIEGRYGKNVPSVENPTRQGYDFDGWEPELPLKFEESKEYTAKWKPSKNTPYKVDSYIPRKNEGYDIDTKTYYGTTNSMTSVIPLEYEGFSVDVFDIEKDQKLILPDGSTVVKVYYRRNFYNIKLYKDNDLVYKEIKGYYGDKISAILNPEKSGYDFVKWSPELPAEIKTITEYYAVWNPRTDTPYKVEHWKQNMNKSGYSKVIADNEQKEGTTDEYTQAEAKTYSGYKAQDVIQQRISGDGSTIIKIYYDIID